ncbi:MAG: 1-acyl-sn-glycerol-3-phosphate acyltransferase [Clostridium sp.]|nr:1-acyl-sn-glycerol-3-phosphate acyltransferase [Prevotella sp.]MCM1429313.1 1-acyl-sn-glycerol-3-phosphate acyltransferase [Clostridium sp.]MCM1475654.1 1-acyl-sn-glycerol-3-phosphate acyltransferase [Muribaculaceae bacterium]
MILFFRIYQWIIAYPILLILTILTALTTIVGTTLGKRDFWGYYPAKIWSRCVCTLLFVRVVVKGKENIESNQSYVFVANHQSAFDIWTIYGYLNHNFKWLMKKGLENIPLVGKACKDCGHIFVDDSKITSIRETIKESEETLRDGMSLVIFPEGSRSWDGKMIPFKRGAFMLAGEFNLPVVPLTIDGAFSRMPRYTYQTRPGKITLTIHKPIFPGERGFNTKKLMAQCHEYIQSALPEEFRGESLGHRPGVIPDNQSEVE